MVQLLNATESTLKCDIEVFGVLKFTMSFSEVIDEPFVELTVENESIKKSLNLLSEQLKQTGEEKVKFEENIKGLKVELERAIAMSKASDSKVCKTVQSDQALITLFRLNRYFIGQAKVVIIQPPVLYTPNPIHQDTARRSLV